MPPVVVTPIVFKRLTAICPAAVTAPPKSPPAEKAVAVFTRSKLVGALIVPGVPAVNLVAAVGSIFVKFTTVCAEARTAPPPIPSATARATRMRQAGTAKIPTKNPPKLILNIN